MSKPKVQRKIITQKKKGSDQLPQKKVMPLRPPVLIFLISLCLVLATLSVFWSMRHCEFISLDDDVYVTDNPNVKAGLTSKGVIWAFTAFHASNWHPLTWLSHMLDCELFGLSPGWHHLTSLLFHIVNTLLLFLVLKRMTGAPWGSSFVAALFALHPLHVESVAWVAERKDVLSTFFWMLTMWAYIRYVERPGIRRYLGVLIFFVMGLMSKPMLVTLPFVLLLLDYWPLGRLPFGQPGGDSVSSIPHSSVSDDSRTVALRLIQEKIPFFLLSVVSSIFTIFAQQSGGAVVPLERLSFETRFANALVSYVMYIGKMIWPHPLAIYYPYPDKFHLWQVAGASLFLVSVSLLVVRFARRYPYLLVGWLWYLGTLVPVIGLAQVGMQSMADRYTYLPFIGLFIMIAKGLPDILMKWRYQRIVIAISAALLLFISSFITMTQIKHWQNGVTLFEHTLNVTVNNFMGHFGLGVALAQQGRIQEAIVHYYEALRIYPSHAPTHNNLGATLVRQRKYQEAITHYTEALRINPRYVDVYYNLGLAHTRQDKFPEAITYYVEALRIDPHYVNAHNGLGFALSRQGRLQEGILHYDEALRISPNYAEAHNNLGVARARLGEKTEAIHHFIEALRIKPEYVEVYINLGNTLSEQGRMEEAIIQYSKALRIKPDFGEAHFYLGLAYLMMGNRNAALEEHKILKTINSDLANILSQKIFR